MSLKRDSFPHNKRVVSLSGGTGGYTFLRGIVQRNQPELITAVTGTHDSGGSSGRLRTEWGVLPSGDIKQCALALIEDDEKREVARRLFNDRLAEEEGPLKGHTIGNLVESVLQRIYGGQDRSIDALRTLLEIRANIVPITLNRLDLAGKTERGLVVEGETNIDTRGEDPDYEKNPDPITDIYFEQITDTNPKAIKALSEAELIVFAPGDLFTSILPHLKVAGIPEAIQESQAKLCMILNLMTKPGETDDFKASDFVRILVNELMDPGRLDYIIANKNGLDEETRVKYAKQGQVEVEIDETECKKLAPNAQLVVANISHHFPKERLIRHDEVKLAETILALT